MITAGTKVAEVEPYSGRTERGGEVVRRVQSFAVWYLAATGIARVSVFGFDDLAAQEPQRFLQLGDFPFLTSTTRGGAFRGL